MLTKFLCDEDAPISVSQISIKVAIQYLKLLENEAEVMSGIQGHLKGLLAEHNAGNKVVYVRLFELAVNVAVSSKILCETLAKEPIGQVFAEFESLDMLTQVTIMDFVVVLMESPNGVAIMNESGFIQKLFEKHAGDQTFVRSNMLLVGAKLFSMGRFDAFESPNYMEMLRFFVCAPIDNDKPHLKDIGLNALIFLFMRRDKFIPGFIETPENHDLINALLRVSKTTIQEHRKTFLIALR